MDTITAGIQRHRRSLLLVALGLIILLLHGVVYARSNSTIMPGLLPGDLTDFDSEELNVQLAEQQTAFTRLLAAATVLPMVGQALIVAGLIGWVLSRPANSTN